MDGCVGVSYLPRHSGLTPDETHTYTYTYILTLDPPNTPQRDRQDKS
jgi:hypothetical protein